MISKDWTEEKEERLEEIFEAMNSWEVIREYEPMERARPLYDQLISSLWGIIGSPPGGIIKSKGISLEISSTYSHGYKVKEKVKDSVLLDEKVQEKLKKAVDRDEDFYGLFDVRGKVKTQLQDPSQTMNTACQGFNLTFDDGKNSKDVDAINKHLSGIVLGYCFSDYLESDIKDEVAENIMRQLRVYVETGELNFRKKEEIDLDKMDYFEPMVFLNDHNFELVWKHSKFCRFCGEGKRRCFCKPVRKGFEEDDVLGDLCWDCRQEAIHRAFKEDYNEKYTEELCKDVRGRFFDCFMERRISREELKEDDNSLDAVFEPVEGDEEDYPLLELRNCDDEEKIQDAIDYVVEFYSHGDPEPPENSCTCPTFTEQVEA